MSSVTPLSRHFHLEQLLHSDTALERGIDNWPNEAALANLRRLAAGLDRVQDLLGHPLNITSGFRCPELNKAVGGTANSQHCQGLAADFDSPEYGTPMEIALAIARSDIDFDQCIMEFGHWVHLSFAERPRRRVLTIYSATAGYQEGLFEPDGRRLA
jgi:zinc D-Ala-D-Ala carboxypeptidase